LYSRDQFEQLRFVKERLDEGLPAADAHRLLVERLAGVLPVLQEPPVGARGGRLVLLAYRDRHGAELSEFFLRAEGFEVVVALSAGDAEELFVSRGPVLSVVELMISGGVGRELCEWLKERRGATPVLCVSSLDLREQALAAGADAFLGKPFEPLELVSTVRDLLGGGGVVREAASAA
jgi:DNA-binding response OmpR family regulator